MDHSPLGPQDHSPLQARQPLLPAALPGAGEGGRVEYVTDEGKRSLYWNIPIANTTVVLLGTGTSITQAAMRELAKAGVMVGFSGGGGTPLYSANEMDIGWPGSRPQANTARRNTCSTGCGSGSTTASGWPPPRPSSARLERIAQHWAGNRRLNDGGFSIASEG